MKAYKLLLLILTILLLLGCKINTASNKGDTLIVLTFDDQHETIYTVALPIMQEFGYVGTNFVNSESIGLPTQFNWEQLQDMELNNNWETGGHTLHHINMPYFDDETMEYEVLQDKQNIIDHGLNPVSFALPRGHATQQQLQFLSQHYDNIRNSQDQRHVAPINRLNLGYFSYKSEHTAASAKARIIRGIENSENIIIIGFHRFIYDLDTHPNACTPEDFRELLEFIESNNLEVTTLKNAVDRFCSN